MGCSYETAKEQQQQPNRCDISIHNSNDSQINGNNNNNNSSKSSNKPTIIKATTIFSSSQKDDDGIICKYKHNNDSSNNSNSKDNNQQQNCKSEQAQTTSSTTTTTEAAEFGKETPTVKATKYCRKETDKKEKKEEQEQKVEIAKKLLKQDETIANKEAEKKEENKPEVDCDVSNSNVGKPSTFENAQQYTLQSNDLSVSYVNCHLPRADIDDSDESNYYNNTINNTNCGSKNNNISKNNTNNNTDNSNCCFKNTTSNCYCYSDNNCNDSTINISSINNTAYCDVNSNITTTTIQTLPTTSETSTATSTVSNSFCRRQTLPPKTHKRTPPALQTLQQQQLQQQQQQHEQQQQQKNAQHSYRTATAAARSMAATMAATCAGSRHTLQEMLLHARTTLTTRLMNVVSNSCWENINYGIAVGKKTYQQHRQQHCHQQHKHHQRRRQQKKQQQQQHHKKKNSQQHRQQQIFSNHTISHSSSSSCTATASANSPSTPATSSSSSSSSSAPSTSYTNCHTYASAASAASAAAYNYIGHNYYHLLRNSISFYAASSVILVLCYLTTTTSAAAANSDTSAAPLEKHPIQGIDWSKFDESSSDKEILDLLLEKKRYDKRLLPPVNDEDFCCGLSSPDMAKNSNQRRLHNRGTLTVNVNVLLLSLASPDESSLKYEVEFLLNQQWNDPRLQYGNKSHYDFLNALHHHDSIWTPDTYFIMHGDFKDPIIPMHFALRIYRNGTITYAMRRHLILSCQGSLHIFPFDDPKCSFSMESISYEEAQIKYVWKNDEDTLRKSPSLTTLNAYLIKNQTTACDQNSWRGNYSCLRVDLIFTRDRAFYFTTVFIPGIILVTSSFITFWLEWNAVPARSMIGVTTMLNFFTTSNGFRSTLPVVSNLTAMNVWDGVCMCFIYASLLEFVCVNYVGRKRPLHNVVYRPGENPVTQRLPAVLSRIGVILASPLPGEKRRDAGAPNEIVACTTCGGSNSPCTHSANNGCATETCFVQVRKKEPPHPIRVAKTIDVIARITFPTAYAIFLIFFFVHYKGFS